MAVLYPIITFKTLHWAYLVIHSFYFPPIIAKRRKLTEEYTSQLLEGLVDEHRAADSCTLDCNDDGTSDGISQAADFESSDDNILDEFS